MEKLLNQHSTKSPPVGDLGVRGIKPELRQSPPWRI